MCIIQLKVEAPLTNHVYANTDPLVPPQSDVTYAQAGPQYFTLERDSYLERRDGSRLTSQTSEERYEAVPRLYGMDTLGSGTTWSGSTGRSHKSEFSQTYDDVVANGRNTLPYQAPPSSEKDVYATMKRSIYVHLQRSSLFLQEQIGQG